MSQTILVAEDDETVTNFVSLALERANFIVLLACNADEALQVSRSQAIDLLLADVNMGEGMNGVELAERIVEVKPETKVLVTGFPERELLVRAKQLPFLGKPFTASILIETVRTVLSNNSPHSETETTSR